MSKPDLRVCFLGDSYVAGYGDPTGRGWPGRVLESAWAEGADLTLYNLGVRRETGPEVAARIEEARPRFKHGDRAAVAVAFGANDIDLNVSTDETLRALATIIRFAGENGWAVFVVSPPIFLDEPAFDAAAAALTAAMAGVCSRWKVPFLNLREAVPDWSAWWEEASAGDGSHPSGAYALIADAFTAWPAWRSWLGH